MPPTPGEVERICAIPDPVVRNLEITWCYFRLSTAFSERVGGCANWCTFAVWASRQAGRTVRAEDLLLNLSGRLGPGFRILEPVNSVWRILLRRGILSPRTRLGRLVDAIHSPFDAFERASQSVSRGNLQVFKEIGWHFAKYIETHTLDHFDPASPLRTAFALYDRQDFETNPNTRAEMILLANLIIGLHEQTRLQPEIQAAMESPSVTAGDLGRRCLAVFGFFQPVALIAVAAGTIALPFARFARALTRLIVTERLMTLDLAGAPLRLGHHLDAATPDALLKPSLPELMAFSDRFEPADCSDCGARDWADLNQRMHYILHLFRAYQYETELLRPPFKEDQAALILDGRIPDGVL